MEITNIASFNYSKAILATLQVVVGSLFLALMAQIAIPLPFTPVPISLQTLGVAFLAVTLGGRKAALATILYLFQATYGLPVLAGGTINPLWLASPRAGYLLGFVLAAFTTGSLLESRYRTSWMFQLLSLALNEGIILSIGTLWISAFVGFENSFWLGMWPFIPGACIKVGIAFCLIKPIKYGMQLINQK